MNTTINLLDCVAMNRDRPELDLATGDVGVVVMVHSERDFEVEFLDDDGRTYGLHTLNRDDLIPLTRRGRAFRNLLAAGAVAG